MVKILDINSTRAGHELGLPLFYDYLPRRGESEPSPAGRLPPPPVSRASDKNASVTTTRYIFFAQACQAVTCWILRFRSCATPLGTSRRGTLTLYEVNVYRSIKSSSSSYHTGTSHWSACVPPFRLATPPGIIQVPPRVILAAEKEQQVEMYV